MIHDYIQASEVEFPLPGKHLHSMTQTLDGPPFFIMFVRAIKCIYKTRMFPFLTLLLR